MSKVYPPTVIQTPEAPGLARDQLREAGPMSGPEKIMATTFVLLLALWCLSDVLGIDATTSAFVGITVLLVTGALKWKDLAQNTSAWTTLVFFAVLVGMANQLNELGVIGWIGDSVADSVSSLPWVAAFLSAAIGTGAPPVFSALVFGFIGSLFGGLAHYSSGPCGVIYGSGYVKTTEWFRVGSLMSIVIIAIWTVVGGAWMKLLGYW
jgi:divalent anion:Na+ symporter, DASS family